MWDWSLCQTFSFGSSTVILYPILVFFSIPPTHQVSSALFIVTLLHRTQQSAFIRLVWFDFLCFVSLSSSKNISSLPCRSRWRIAGNLCCSLSPGACIYQKCADCSRRRLGTGAGMCAYRSWMEWFVFCVVLDSESTQRGRAQGLCTDKSWVDDVWRRSYVRQAPVSG